MLCVSTHREVPFLPPKGGWSHASFQEIPLGALGSTVVGAGEIELGRKVRVIVEVHGEKW